MAELETKTYSIGKILELVRAGRVRIPRFQRDFRWLDEDRRLLFDSLDRGFPVGTLLLASGEAPAGRVTLGDFMVEVPAMSDALWVVDGQQRLTTLSMSLLARGAGAYRPIYYALEEERFVLGVRRREPPSTWLPTWVLGRTSSLTAWLRDQSLPESLSDRADSVAQRIREYELPAYLVPYEDAEGSRVREIFARINRRGRSLDSDEVFHALHASAEGLDPLQQARDDLAGLGFGTLAAKDVESAAKAVAKLDPGVDLVDQMTKTPLTAAELFGRVGLGLNGAVEFLSEDCGVPHVELLPYKSPLYALARFFSLHPSPHPHDRELLVRWFYRGLLGDAFRLGTANYRKQWNAVDDDASFSVQRLLAQVSPVPSDTLPRVLEPFLWSKARSKLEMLAAADLCPRVLFGENRGELVSLATLAEAKSDGLWQVAYPLHARTLAQYLLHPCAKQPRPGDHLDPTSELGAFLAMEPDLAALATHAVDRAAFEALVRGDHVEFLDRRANMLTAQLSAFVALRAQLEPLDRDRSPLESYAADSA